MHVTSHLRLLLLGLAIGSAQAAVYYVDPSIGSDAYTGTSPTLSGQVGPWKTVAKVQAAALVAGDEVRFKAGSVFTTGLTITRSGMATAQLLFGRYGAGTPPMFQRGANRVDDGVNIYDHNSAIEVKGSYITIDGLGARKAQEDGVGLGAGTHHNIVRNCTISDVGTGININGSSNNLVENNIIESLHMILNSPRSINDNDDYGAAAIGIGPGSVDNIIQRNTCTNCKVPSYDYTTDGGGVEFWSDGAAIRNTIIRYNIFANNNSVVEAGGRNGGGVYGVRFGYNLCYNNGCLAAFHTGDVFSIAHEALCFDNNTVVEYANAMGLGVIVAFDNPPADPGQFRFTNNIFYVGPTYWSIGYNWGGVTASNIFYRADPNYTSHGFTLGSGDIDADPRFLAFDPANLSHLAQDFRLQQQSPGVDTGLDLRSVGAYPTDMDGGQLYVGKPDRGAYERAVAVPVLPAITTQPVGKTVVAGQTAEFRVTATGTPSPGYQWQRNGVDIAGATASTYVTPATVVGDSGAAFRVVVSNAAGSVVSQSVSLTVTASGGALPTRGDIGSVTKAGSTTVNGGLWTLIAHGGDLWKTTDGFHMASRSVTGDVRITARIVSVTTADSWARAGVMIRETRTAGSPYAMCLNAASIGSAFQRRLVTGEGTRYTAGPYVRPPTWVRVERIGNMAIASVSTDGSAWKEVGRHVLTMAATVEVGLAVTAHGKNQTCTAVFSDVEIVAATAGGG